ncbi:unnamed protein product [Symbiodinium natans]|uniref:Ubiquitin-like domain-containing protein n=1 Tax=Symbiodinium natans TaxID=878477 RepID=A0A812T028_9DINO|nr:unnamed protein product [Symbiodinium natans]
MAYVRPHMEDYQQVTGQIEVLVRSIGGTTLTYNMDKTAIIGDLKQRITKQTGVKYHEIRLVLQHQQAEPDTFEKIYKYATRGSPLEMSLVVMPSCRWCNVHLTAATTTVETDIGEYCSQRCHALMSRELQDPNSVFAVFGISAETQPRPQQQLPPAYATLGYETGWGTEPRRFA